MRGMGIPFRDAVNIIADILRADAGDQVDVRFKGRKAIIGIGKTRWMGIPFHRRRIVIRKPKGQAG